MNKQARTARGPKPTKACASGQRMFYIVTLERRLHVQPLDVHLYLPAVKASALHDLLELEEADLLNIHPAMRDHQSVLDRLDRIETVLGIDRDAQEDSVVSPASPGEKDCQQISIQGAWSAITHLKSITRPAQEEAIWSKPNVKCLWTSFLNNLPLLHFLKDRDAFDSPTPLLLASVLYISALHHKSSEMASLEAGYFTAICCAIAELASSSSNPSPVSMTEKKSPDVLKREAFHNILGLIMASLSSEAYVATTGLWIAMGYRLWLDHCPLDLEASTLDWRGLFSGLQVIDIEHASIHMSYPLIPRQPLTPGIQRLDSHQGNAFQGLAEMMHFGLSHFVGRGLPTIWCSINAEISDYTPVVQSPFTERDSEIIRLWARKLDDWLVRYNGASQPSPSDKQGILILLQYHLHKLYVLSIYHPARGFNISSANISPVERHELLVSARAVLRLRQDDASIWSNWDLIMITWAAILLLRGVEDGMTHQDDLHLIHVHLQSLERSSQSTASIHTVLSQRLEYSVQAMHTPPDTSSALVFPGPSADDSWTIFDHEIMSLANPPWLFEDSTPFSHNQKSLGQVPAGLPVPYAGLLDNSAQSFGVNAVWNDAD
ncbi:uncharacterized protein N7484_011616 [Penicillium longicatenatum]|uniref:uncharacterized protein n=1 Tax=Penicillium longicatenatum TaxID=1561947 RepID=UPI0025465868|nr:uncharacterized protein N7484_011616 [Penicillium longicatenatum]KAJ5631516.1 hypothetical protein N7484_011616 [Penicillium longicatenatum]